MASKQQKDGTSLFKGVFMAYFVLILHVLLIGGVGILILFFRGVVSYTVWIFLGCSLFLIASGYYFYIRLKREGEAVGKTMRSSAFRGRAVEVSVLGGLASFKVGRPDNMPHMPTLNGGVPEPLYQLEDPTAMRIRKLKDLASLLEKDLITMEEYNQTKKEIFNS